MSKTSIFLFGPAIVLLLLTSSCADNNSASDSSLSASVEVLATVNGSPVTKQEVLDRINKNKRNESADEPGPARMKKVLESIIQQEIASQKAVALGLDKDPGYQEQLLHLQTQLANFKRKKLSEVFYRHEVNLKAEVTDAEVAAYATENAARLQTEVSVWQILRRDRKQIQQVKAELDQGEAFETVAAKRFPELPDSMRNPWELGYLNWEQIPDAWWDTLENLTIGETSEIIQAPNRRYWIIKLVDKRPYANYSLEASKTRIKAILKHDKMRELRASTVKALREDATIIYTSP